MESESFEALEARRLMELTAAGLTADEARAIALDEWHRKTTLDACEESAQFPGEQAPLEPVRVVAADSQPSSKRRRFDCKLGATNGSSVKLEPELQQSDPSERHTLAVAEASGEAKVEPATEVKAEALAAPAAVAAAPAPARAGAVPRRRAAQSVARQQEVSSSVAPGTEPEGGGDWIRPAEYVQTSASVHGDDDSADVGLAPPSGDDDAERDHRFAAFRRSRLMPRLGVPHPDWLTEPLAISRVTMPPLSPQDPPIRLPHRLANRGLLSSPQLETVAYAVRRFRCTLPDGSRAGYYLGDGTGTGKGRVIAALLLHLWNEGARRHLWLSASADLLEDAKRDLRDLGANLPLAALGDIAYGKITGPKPRGSGAGSSGAGLATGGDGIIFATYSLLVASKAGDKDDCGGRSSRLAQVIEWLGGAEARGLVAFDEAHKAKNTGAGSGVGGEVLAAGASKTGMCVAKLQRSCPGIACLYASATGATEIKHLGYMERLGLVGPGRPHKTFDELRCAVERSGLAAMELVAITMRAEGMLSCRALSFRGATFGLRVMSLDDEQKVMYATAAALWQSLLRGILDLLNAEKKRLRAHFGKNANRHVDTAMIMRHFWAQEQRFFRQLLVCLKVGRAVKLAQEALLRGEQVVISMWSTGEAQTEARLLGDAPASKACKTSSSTSSGGAAAVRRNTAASLTDFVCGLEVMVDRLLTHTFEPLVHENRERAVVQALRRQLSDAKLPPNPLDTLLEQLGGPEKVAELTGRQRRLLSTSSGAMVLDERISAQGASERANITEQRAFQEGRKKVAIITEAASAGISLHAEKREGASQAQRYMLTLELPWEADKAVQQLGRVHRSNQAQPPRFAVLLTELGGECRFASAIARRMRLLGAITRGDRGAAADLTGGLADFDVQNVYGKRALDNFYKLLRTRFRCPVQLPFVGIGKKWRDLESYYKAAEVALSDIGIKLDTDDRFDESLKEGKSLNTFLNRILMLPPDMQNALFETAHALYEHEVHLDHVAGTYDPGLETLNRRHGQRVQVDIVSKEVLFTDPDTGAETTHVRLRLDRGVPWEAAEQLHETRCEEVSGDGFYWWRRDGPPGSPELPALAVAATTTIASREEEDEDERLFVLHTPQGALTKLPGSPQRLTREALASSDRFRKASLQQRADIARAWKVHHAKAFKVREGDPNSCFKEIHVLGGSILNVWGAVGAAIRGHQNELSTSKRERLPLLRANIKDTDEAVVGVRVDAARLPEVRYALRALLESRYAAGSSAPSSETPAAEGASAGAAAPVAAVDPPSFDVVHEHVKKHLEKFEGQCDPTWSGWGEVHAFLLGKGVADNSADCVVAVQHWVSELVRCRVLDRHPESDALRIRPVVNNSGWYMPPPKPKPLPKRGGRGRGGRGRGRSER